MRVICLIEYRAWNPRWAEWLEYRPGGRICLRLKCTIEIPCLCRNHLAETCGKLGLDLVRVVRSFHRWGVGERIPAPMKILKGMTFPLKMKPLSQDLDFIQGRQLDQDGNYEGLHYIILLFVSFYCNP